MFETGLGVSELVGIKVEIDLFRPKLLVNEIQSKWELPNSYVIGKVYHSRCNVTMYQLKCFDNIKVIMLK